MCSHGVMFHHFHGPGHAPSQGSISADALRDMIRAIGTKHILPAQQFLEQTRAGRIKQSDVCLTFDDNLLCQYDIALPVLQEFGLTAFWFIYTGPFDGQFEKLEIYRSFRNQRFNSVDAFYHSFEMIVSEEIDRSLNLFDPKKYLAEFPFYSESDRRFRFIRDEILGPQHYHAAMNRM
ncbi:MAG TPA: hypothetical protein VHD56_06315, partial [Tepidisphaeraceae bacterium]|nr:hypothetical protein [Tepidisphaeraceae bacterium]